MKYYEQFLENVLSENKKAELAFDFEIFAIFLHLSLLE